jgi:hypothetical protein
MKSIKLLLITFASVVLCLNLTAIEYVTLTKNNPVRTMPSNSLVEVVGLNWSVNDGSGPSVEMTFTNGDVVFLSLASSQFESRGAAALNPTQGRIFTGVTKFDMSNNGTRDFALTLKITPASQINPVGPNTFLVLPEGSQGEYDVIVEYSTDLTNWQPFMSQFVGSESAPNFFRARIQKRAAE